MSNFDRATARPWRWAEGWKEWGPKFEEYDGKKYLDLMLLGESNQEIIPARIDHHELILDVEMNKPFISEADRVLIVQAVNSFDAMRKALQAFIDCQEKADTPEKLNQLYLHACDLGRTALKLAEGK